MPISRSRSGHQAPSMADVAEIAGVSHQTVSRVLNNKGIVRPETRERVLEAIRETGYRRNETARALATNRSKVIGIITPTFVHYGPATTLLSLQLAANDIGYIVSVATLYEFSPESLRHALDQFLSQNVAGIVVIAPVTQIAHELENVDLPVPTICIASAWITPHSRLTRIGVEQRGGVHALIGHLAASGCRTIGHIGGPVEWFDALEREAAWRDAMASHHLEFGPILRGDWTASSGYTLTRGLLEGSLPDALFVANDQMALGALHACAEAGVGVPETLRIVGYDDEDTSAYLTPSLTTVKQNFQQLGSEAIAALIRISQGEAVSDRTLPAELHIRTSG